MEKTKFSYKRLTSLLITWCFVALVLTGVVMFINPPGRIANWTDWRFLGLNKEGWHSIHVLMGIVFLVGGLFHLLKFNWKVFLSYLQKKGNANRRVKESVVSLGIFSLFLFGSIAAIPPFSSVMEFSESIKNSWEPETNFAPTPHMELQNLKEVAEIMGLTNQKVMEILTREGITVGSAQDTLKTIASENGTSPQDLYLTLDKAARPGKNALSSNEGQIPGLGRLTVDDVVKRLDLDMTQTLDRLKQRGIEAQAGVRVRALAEENNLSPHDLLEIMRN